MEMTSTAAAGVSPKSLGTAQTYTVPEGDFWRERELRTLVAMSDALDVGCTLYVRCSWYINYTSLTTRHHPSCTRIKPPLNWAPGVRKQIWHGAKLLSCGSRVSISSLQRPCGQIWGQSVLQPVLGRDTGYGAAQSAGSWERAWEETQRAVLRGPPAPWRLRKGSCCSTLPRRCW